MLIKTQVSVTLEVQSHINWICTQLFICPVKQRQTSKEFAAEAFHAFR